MYGINHIFTDGEYEVEIWDRSSTAMFEYTNSHNGPMTIYFINLYFMSFF